MTHEKELIELLDKGWISEDATLHEHQSKRNMQEWQTAIEATFREFGRQGSIVHAYSCAPQVTCFDFSIGPNENLLDYFVLKDNIQMAIEQDEIRMLVPTSDQQYGRIEIAKKYRAVVTAGEMFRSTEWCDSCALLPVMMGKSVEGRTVILDLARAPHLLMAGCAGSGKTVFMNSCIHSLMFRHTPCELKLILADSKIVGFSKYKNLPYLQFPVINSTRDTLRALQWLNMEMERRYKVIGDAGCREIKTLNEQRPCSLPYIVMIIDEFSDFMAQAKTQMESLLANLCARGRAAGIHLIISTQRPDYRVLTRSIRANFPVRIAFRVAAHTDSQRILDVGDAADLLRFGDMLFRGPGIEKLTRIQGVYVNGKESARIIDYLKSMYGDMKPNALPPMRGTMCNQFDALHSKLIDIARDALEDNLDYLTDHAIDDACEEIADSIIEHWDELKETGFNMDEEHKGDDEEEADSEFDEVLSEEEKEMLPKAIQIVIETKRTSISYIQRNLRIGYNRACVLMAAMDRYGIVSPQSDNRPRSGLVDTYEEAIGRLPADCSAR